MKAARSLDIDISDRDKLFREAAEVIVIAQQGSASLLQRKLKLGYNRAGRLNRSTRSMQELWVHLKEVKLDK